MTIQGRNNSDLFYNRTGSTLHFGDIAVVSTLLDNSVVASSSAFANGSIVVCTEPNGLTDYSSDAVHSFGAFAFSGKVSQLNLDTSATDGQIVKCSSTPSLGTPHNAPFVQGDFAQVVGTGTSPQAILFGYPSQIGASQSYYAPSGLTGATNPSRYVGGTASGAPVSGTFNKGDYIIDATGIFWICTTAGSPGTWSSGTVSKVLLGTNTPSGVATTTFSSISSAYRKLILEIAVRSSKAAYYDALYMQFNSDTTAANYRGEEIYAGVGTFSHADAATYQISDGINAASAPANEFSIATIEIPHYTNTTFNKHALFRSSNERGSSSSYLFMISSVLNWANTVAINRIDLTIAGGNFVANSIVRLYGEY